jgi:hypothetical protein
MALSLQKVVGECLHGTLSMACAGDETTDVARFLVDCIDRIGWARGHSGVCGIEHFQVVVTVADCEAALGRETVVVCDVAEAAAFLKFPVAEAQVDRISLP